MKPSPFSYHRPSSTSEAVALLGELGGGAKVLAGGQSLVPLLSMRLAAPEHLVDVNHIPGLDTVDVTGEHVRVGALVRHSALEHHGDAYAAAPLLRQGLELVAHPTIRNRGTTVGSLVHGDPSAEMPAVLVLLGGVVEVLGSHRARDIDAGAFFTGAMETAVAPHELAVAARFTRPPGGSGTAFVELARRHGDYAMCGVAALVVTDPDAGVTAARVALISVGDGPVLVDLTPAVTGSGGGFDHDGLRDLVDERIQPETDIHATDDYRRHLAHALTARALEQAQAHAVERRRDERAA